MFAVVAAAIALRTAANMSFVIGGAQKAGTTSLAMFLGLGHIEGVCMHKGTEVHYWDLRYKLGSAWYNSFCKGTCICGEKSPSYMISTPAIERMARDAPHMKWIIQLREPVARAYSEFKFLVHSNRTFEDALKNGPRVDVACRS